MKNVLASLARVVAMSAALGAFHGLARASDVYDDNGNYIGQTDGCSAGDCDIINDDGDHIGSATGCLRADECDVTNDDGDHIGTAEANDE